MLGSDSLIFVSLMVILLIRRNLGLNNLRNILIKENYYGKGPKN